jgi:HEPN domain-containing protein/predicted nucleotidyltransferase
MLSKMTLTNIKKRLKPITEKLIREYDPDRIILFGSYGREESDAESDIDLLIIKETPEEPLKRQMEVERILADRIVPLDILVYTPEEVRLLYRIGSPFMEEVMRKGKVLFMRKVTEYWVHDAGAELDAAVILLEHGKYRAACYHGQQCVEKALKAFMLEKGKQPGRIHDLVELLNRAEKLGLKSGLTMDDAVFLNSIYRGRYSTEEGLLPHGEPSPEDAEQSLRAAHALMKQMQSL